MQLDIFQNSLKDKTKIYQMVQMHPHVFILQHFKDRVNTSRFRLSCNAAKSFNASKSEGFHKVTSSVKWINKSNKVTNITWYFGICSLIFCTQLIEGLWEETLLLPLLAWQFLAEVFTEASSAIFYAKTEQCDKNY